MLYSIFIFSLIIILMIDAYFDLKSNINQNSHPRNRILYKIIYTIYIVLLVFYFILK